MVKAKTAVCKPSQHSDGFELSISELVSAITCEQDFRDGRRTPLLSKTCVYRHPVVACSPFWEVSGNWLTVILRSTFSPFCSGDLMAMDKVEEACNTIRRSKGKKFKYLMSHETLLSMTMDSPDSG